MWFCFHDCDTLSFRCMCKIDNCTYINILAELYENSSLVMNINNVFSSFVLFFFSGARILVQCRAKLYSVLKRLEQKTLWYLLMRYSECARDNAIHQNFLTSIESTCTTHFKAVQAVLSDLCGPESLSHYRTCVFAWFRLCSEKPYSCFPALFSESVVVPQFSSQGVCAGQMASFFRGFAWYIYWGTFMYV